MPHYVVFYKPDSGLITLISEDKKRNLRPQPLPGLSFLRLFSPAPLQLTKWMVRDSKLVAKPPQLLPDPNLRVPRILLLSDPPASPTGFGVQSCLLANAFRTLGYEVGHVKLLDYAQYYNWEYSTIISLSDLAQVLSLVDLNPIGWFHWLPVSTDNIESHFWERLQKIPFVVSMTDFGKNQLLQKGFDQTRVSYIPHAVDTSVFQPVSSLVRSTRRRDLGLESRFVCLFVGTNRVRKRIDILLNAFSQALATNPDLYLILKTPPEGDFPITKLLDQLGIEGSVGLVDDHLSPENMSELYGVADCYVSASEAEGFGVPLIEALACGLPVIVGDNPVSRSVLGPHGVYVSSGRRKIRYYDYSLEHFPPDPREFSQALLAVGASQKLLPGRDQRLAYARLNFAPGVVGRQWDELILKTPPPTPRIAIGQD